MKVYLRFILIPLVCGSILPAVLAQETLWKEFTLEAARLVQQGKYPDAVDMAKRALEMAQETFGRDHPNVAISLTTWQPCIESRANMGKRRTFTSRALP